MMGTVMQAPLLIAVLVTVLQSSLSDDELDKPCQKIFTKMEGSLQSPNFPDMYEDFTVCEYYIRPVLSADDILRVTAVTFNLEGGYDYLEVREMGPHGRQFGHYTGTVIPNMYGKAFWMRFTSDFSNPKIGFKLTWKTVRDGVRLVNGTDGLDGRVEVFHGAKWGTICDDSWDDNEAFVACKQLGFTDPGAKAFTQAFYGRGLDPIWLDNLKCSKNMSTFEECKIDSWGTHNCNHGEDAGAKCTDAFKKRMRSAQRGTSFPKGCGGYFPNNSGEIQSPQFPFYPNYANCQYTIAPKLSKKLVSVKFQVFDLQEDYDFVEIREDGPRGAFLGRFSGSNLPPITFAKRLWLFFSTDSSIGRTGFKFTWEVVETGVRLRNGTRPNEGRLELFSSGMWGTACDDNWEAAEAKVVCRMLGYSTDNATALKGGTFGPGSGEIVLDDTSCTGFEDSLHECPSSSEHNCNHYEDAAVRCDSPTPISPKLVTVENVRMSKRDPSEAVNVSCDSMTMTVSVDLAVLGDSYPSVLKGSTYWTLATDDCMGQRSNNSIVINTDITDCGMTSTERGDYIVYSNRLISHVNQTWPKEAKNVTYGVPDNIIIPVVCSLSKTVRLAGRILSYKKPKKEDVVRGFGTFNAELNFYKDPNYAMKITDFPVVVELGQAMYVETKVNTKDKFLEAILYDCMATPGPNSSDTDTLYLIKNRCAMGKDIRLLPAPSNTSSQFVFKTFQFLQHTGDVYIRCSLMICNVTSTASKCLKECPRGPSRRSVNNDLVEVVQGPIILKETTKPEPHAPVTLHIGAIIAGVVVAVLVLVAVVLLVFARKKNTKVLSFTNKAYGHFDASTENVHLTAMELTPSPH